MTKDQSSLAAYLQAENWRTALEDFISGEIFQELENFLDKEYEEKNIFPPKPLIFNAFNLCDLQNIRVVILGQDPYHGAGQAQGLAFSVPKELTKLPPSLRNIFKEIGSQSLHGDLTHWAEQGVFLLNTVLTVEEKKAHSHKNRGWEEFTDRAIEAISSAREGVIFLLWGGPAQEKAKLIDKNRHIILEAPHPSPLSAYRGFFGCGHFDEVNRLLIERQEEPIKWESAFELF